MAIMQSARMVVKRFVIGLIGGCCLAACARADSLDGWWMSDGYGTVVEIKGDQATISEITAISCLASMTAKRQATTEEGVEAVFAIGPERILVKPGSAADHKFFLFKGAASSVGFRRLDKRPAVCEAPAVNSPLNNFDVFWTTFAEHYPFFAMRGVDWPRVRDEYRPKITDATTAEELFGIFKAMVEPLHDAHTFISGVSQKQRFHGLREHTERLDDKTEGKIRELIEARYTHEKLKTWCNGRVSYGVLPDALGYLRITAFGGYAFPSDFDSQAKALDEALDKALEDADKLHGLIVDVRINHGGSDVLGVAVASRLATKEYLAFAKKARNDPTDPSRYTALQQTQVHVSSRPHFDGPVVLLTGSNTISAGETFTMALMGRTPRVTRVGENTQGVFSDVLGRKLPNGFRFGLPNEIFVTEDGTAFDGPGIPPDLQIPVFPNVDLDAGRDGALEKAIEILRGK